MDIVLRFNTAYYEDGEIIKDRKKIVYNYLFNNFLLDLITSFILLAHNIINKEF